MTATPEFTLALDRGLVSNFVGFGGQFNNHASEMKQIWAKWKAAGKV